MANSNLDKDAQAETCLHCQGSLESSQKVLANGPASDARFCCAGCQFVYSVIHDLDLDSFYRVREKSGAWSATQPRLATHLFEHFDDELFLDHHSRVQGELVEVDLLLEGVHCVACIWLLEKLPELLAGVHSSDVQFAEASIRIRYNPQQVRLSEIARMLHNLGYHPHPKEDNAVALLQKKERKDLLIRLGVAGVAAGNVMMMSISLYQAEFSGMEESFRKLLYLACFLVSIPAVTFSAFPFYRTAYMGLKHKIIHIDLPVSIGITLGFVMSSFNAYRLNEQVYFDSICILVFLLLMGRWWQLYMLHWASGRTSEQVQVLPRHAVRVDSNGNEKVIYHSRIVPGDILRVTPGSIFPADGVVTKGSSTVDNSIITGEARALPLKVGSPVIAGAKNLSDELEIEVTHPGEQSRIARILKEVTSEHKNSYNQPKRVDRISRIFVPTVLTLTAVCFVFWSLVGTLEQAFASSLALLIITCPCALGLATPLSIGLAIAHAARRGLLIKSADMFEPRKGVEVIFFDKTGTLTSRYPEVDLVYTGNLLSEKRILAIVLALESELHHPIAIALESYARQQHSVLEQIVLDEREELESRGVKASFENAELLLGSTQLMEEYGVPICETEQALVQKTSRQGDTPVFLAINREVHAIFVVKNQLLPGAKELIRSLRQNACQIRIISGDSQAAVDYVTGVLDIDSSHGVGLCSPERKKELIQDAKRQATAIMVGDGVNDSLALKIADISVAVSGGAEVALKVADCYSMESNLKLVETLFKLVKRTRNIIAISLLISLVYNVVGVSLAFSGFITPLMAAILMPLSSLSVVALAYFGTRIERY